MFVPVAFVQARQSVLERYNSTVKGGLLIRPALLSSDKITPRCSAALEEKGFDVVRLPPYSKLAEPVSSHPDMLVFSLGDALVFPVGYYEENKTLLDGIGYPIITANEKISPDYPNDIILNALDAGGVLFGRLDRLSTAVTGAYEKRVAVAQGYSRCSVCSVGDAFITADDSLHTALTANGFDCLKIRSGHILLDGYGYGFIGGASVKLSESETAFFGNIAAHPDYPSMRGFAASHGVSLTSLSDSILTDFGGAVMTGERKQSNEKAQNT